MKDRAELDEEIEALATWVLIMLAETNEASQMDAFAGRAELIEDSAGPDDAAHVRERLQRILIDQCMVPADEGPCA